MKKRIAFLDFDGTITTKDSLLELIKFYKGGFRFFSGMLICSPVLILMKFKLVSSQFGKQSLLSYFFKNIPVELFQSKCDEFGNFVLPKMVRPKAINEIRKLQSLDTETVIVSASAELWLSQWAKNMGVHLIASRLELRDGRITGSLEGKNCRGEEKVKRIIGEYNLSEYQEVYCYGDSKSDLPMLALGTASFYKPFR